MTNNIFLIDTIYFIAMVIMVILLIYIINKIKNKLNEVIILLNKHLDWHKPKVRLISGPPEHFNCRPQFIPVEKGKKAVHKPKVDEWPRCYKCDKTIIDIDPELMIKISRRGLPSKRLTSRYTKQSISVRKFGVCKCNKDNKNDYSSW